MDLSRTVGHSSGRGLARSNDISARFLGAADLSLTFSGGEGRSRRNGSEGSQEGSLSRFHHHDVDSVESSSAFKCEWQHSPHFDMGKPQPRYGASMVTAEGSTGQVAVLFGGVGSGVYGDVYVAEVSKDSDIDTGVSVWTHHKLKGPRPRYFHACTVVGSVMYLFGGYTGSNRLNDLWMLNLDQMQWSQAKARDSPSSRYDHAMTSANNNLYLFGGAGARDKAKNDLWCFNTQSKTWKEIQPTASHPGPRRSHTFTTLKLRDSDKLALFGGYIETDKSGSTYEPLNELWLYEPGLSVWSHINDNPIVPARYGHVAVSSGPTLLVVGGSGANQHLLKDMWYVNPTESKTWQQHQLSLSEPVYRHSGALTEHHLILFGGTKDGVLMSQVLTADTHQLRLQGRMSATNTPRTSDEGKSDLSVDGYNRYVIDMYNNEKLNKSEIESQKMELESRLLGEMNEKRRLKEAVVAKERKAKEERDRLKQVEAEKMSAQKKLEEVEDQLQQALSKDPLQDAIFFPQGLKHLVNNAPPEREKEAKELKDKIEKVEKEELRLQSENKRLLEELKAARDENESLESKVKILQAENSRMAGNEALQKDMTISELEKLEESHHSVLRAIFTIKQKKLREQMNAVATERQQVQISACTLCGEREMNVVLLPCRHRAACSECGKHLAICPVCQEPVNDRIETFNA